MLGGRQQEALAEYRRALEADRLSPFVGSFIGFAYHLARRPREAERQLRQVIEMDSTFYLPHVFLGLTYAAAGDLGRSIAEVEIGTRQDGDLQGLAQKGYVYALAGRRADAERVLQSLEERAPGGYYPHYDAAAIHLALGDRERAFRGLGAAADEKSEALLLIQVDPRFDPLRRDPRFVALVRRIWPLD